jgi:hypothetical protein
VQFAVLDSFDGDNDEKYLVEDLLVLWKAVYSTPTDLECGLTAYTATLVKVLVEVLSTGGRPAIVSGYWPRIWLSMNIFP